MALWVDDFLHMVEACLAADQQDFFLHTLADLGWKISLKKSVLYFSTSAVFVGYRVFSTFGAQKIPWVQALPDKVQKLHQQICQLLSLQSERVQRIASATGQCIGMLRAFAPGQLLLRNLYRDIAQHVDWSSVVSISEAFKSDLHWWSSALESWEGMPLCDRAVQCQISTDASGFGWGGHFLNLHASGSWKGFAKSLHSNDKELLAVFLTLKSFWAQLAQNMVQVLCNNVTTCAYINRMGAAMFSVTIFSNKCGSSVRDTT